MEIKTKYGDEIFCLPDCAKCKLTSINPHKMDSCPIYNFDDKGDICLPELCNYYTEV